MAADTRPPQRKWWSHQTTGRPTRRGVLAGTIVGVGPVSACQLPGETARPSMDARDVTLTYLTDWANGARGDWVKRATALFTAEFPKIKVQVENTASSSGAPILAAASAGTIQDIFFNVNDVFQTMARQGDMKDIAPSLKSLRVNQNEIVSIPSGQTYQGKQYGLPLQLTVTMLTINKTLFRQNGVPLPEKTTTLPQWLDMMRRLSRPSEGIYGFLTNLGWGNWMPLVWGYGGDRWTPDLKKCTFDQPEAIEGLQFFADMLTRHQAATPVNAAGQLVGQSTAFQNGDVGCASAASPGAGTDQQIGGKFEWDVIYMPVGPRTGKRFITTNTNANCVSANASKHDVFDQAVQMVAWMSGSRVAQDLIVETGASTPVYIPVLNSQKFLAGPPTSQKILVDMIPDWKDPQIFTGWTEFRDVVTAALLPALANQTSVPDAAKEMARVGQLVLDKIPK